MLPKHPNPWSELDSYVPLDIPSLRLPTNSFPTPLSTSAGPAIYENANGKVNQRLYCAYFEAGHFYLVPAKEDGSDWDTPIDLGSVSEVPDTITLCFDQLGQAIIFFDAGGNIYHWGYDSISATIKSTLLCPGNNPCAAMDYPINTSEPTTDVLVGYSHNNQLFYRQQRDKYLTEYDIPANIKGPNPVIVEMGFRVDRRFGVYIRYDILDTPPVQTLAAFSEPYQVDKRNSNRIDVGVPKITNLNVEVMPDLGTSLDMGVMDTPTIDPLVYVNSSSGPQ